MNEKLNKYEKAIAYLESKKHLIKNDDMFDRYCDELSVLKELVCLYTQANKSTPKAQVDKIIARYNSIQGLPQVVKLTDSRRRTLNARINDYGIDTIYDMLALVEQSDFLRGNVTEFNANWDWIMNPNNFVKILEGKYNNKEKSNGFESRDDLI